MPLEISEGIKPGPVRGLFYGVEGIGKTSLLAGLPNSLVLDVEQGSEQIDCKRIRIKSADHLTEVLRSLIADQQGFKVIGIDTADWLESMIVEKLCEVHNKTGVEELGGGWGKGYVMVREVFDKYLGLIDRLVEKGISVVFIAHSTVKKVSPPDQTDGYDRYEMKLSKHLGPVLKEWASLILFCNYEISLVEGTDKRVKALGGSKRVMKTTRSAAWDAKNRYGLPEELPMHVSSILPLFIQGETKQPAKVAETAPQTPKVAEPPKQPAPAPEELPAEQLISDDQFKQLVAYASNSSAKAIIETTMEFEAAKTIRHFTAKVAAELLTDLKKAGLEPAGAKPAPEATKTETQGKGPTPSTPAVKTPFPPATVALFTQHEEKINAFFVGKNWLTTGQTWRDLPPESAETAINKTAQLLRAAGVS